MVGAKRVRQLLEGGWRLLGFKARPSPEELPRGRFLDVNASPSLVIDSPEGPIVITADAIEGRISAIWIRLNPDKTVALCAGVPIT